MTALDLRHGWKIFTYEGRSPVQGGSPVLTGFYPVTLPTVELDTGPDECAAGWNYVADIPTGWRVAGLWPTGRPARVVAVKASADAIMRRDKRRASSLTLIREATAQEIHAAFVKFSAPFGVHAARMTKEQAAWRKALTRSHHDPAQVEAQLVLALSVRGLDWTVRQFDTACDAWDAKGARNARDAYAWVTRDAWDAKGAWDARVAWDARDAWARAAWDARATKVSRDAWAAWAAWDAWAALAIYYARLQGWQVGEPDQYTVGLRDAYAAGLAVAWPVGRRTLGWAMEYTAVPGVKLNSPKKGA